MIGSEPTGLAETKRLCLIAREHWAAGRADAALREAWAAYRVDPAALEAKLLLVSLAAEFPGRIAPEMRADLVCLLQDADVAPEYMSTAGWVLLLREPWWNAAANDADCEALAARLDADALALALLRETPVYLRDAERVLTKLRRWLLMSGQWRHHTNLADALIAQATLNGGAWPFGDSEREKLAHDSMPFTAAYLPAAPPAPTPDYADPVTRAVAQGYERWPYPMWRRLMAIETTQRLPDQIRALDPGGPECLPVNAKILIAGCGTGSEAAQIAREYPDAAITAIDLSETSLNYARAQCAALGLTRIRFQKLDLHNISALNERFDAIFSSGVLHHLPDPERGWAALAGVLRAGGVMRIMLYSRIARAWVAQARASIRDLAAEPISDDVLRRVRQRFMERQDDPLTRQVVNASAFATLSGTHDLLLHPQEDAFDIPRIGRALQRLKLRLLSFQLPDVAARARYDAKFPQDRMHRNLQALAFFERSDPAVFLSQYDFWCRTEAFWFR